MEASPSHCRANPERADGNRAHRIAIEIHDLPSDYGGGFHVKDQVGFVLSR
jgi:hypothetical protein